jgi:hypothetical protein
MNNLSNNSNPGNSDINKPIPFDNGDKATSVSNAPVSGAPNVSRAPLNLGGGAKAPAAQAASPAPASRPASPPPARSAAPASVGSGERITGVKTFFTKLHPGALEFMDEQIGGWLKEHPEVSIKHTNVTTGEVQAKKTEPNIIITLWY